MNKYAKLRSMFRSGKPVESSILKYWDIPSQALVDLTRNGEIKRVTRGVYIHSDTPVKTYTDYQILAQAVPHGVLCLTSALKLHGLIDTAPDVMHVALKRGTRIPKVDYPPVEFHLFSDDAYEYGVENHPYDDIVLRAYSMEKTIADCFKFRKQVGLETAVNALKAGLKKRLCTFSDRPGALIFKHEQFQEAAEVCGITKVVEPYMELFNP